MSIIRNATLAAAVATGIMAGSAQAQGFKVIVNASVTDRTISRAQLTRLFFKQDTKFPGGQPASPIDLVASSPAREAFSKAVLGRGVGPVKTFWQGQIFAGRASPPVEKSAESDIVAFVASTPGAVGYVSSGAVIGDGVKLLSIAP